MTRVLLYGPDGKTPRLVENSDADHLAAELRQRESLPKAAFGALLGIAPGGGRLDGEHLLLVRNGTAQVIQQTLGAEALEKVYRTRIKFGPGPKGVM